MKKTTLDISGMHCASCSTLISRALNKKEGVAGANVNLTTNSATIEYNEKKTDESELIKTIEAKGYGAKISAGISIENKEINSLKRRFFVSLMYSLPVFILGMFFMSNPIPFQDYIMWILATPVQFVIASGMYQSAWKALKSVSANMDTLIVMGTSAAYFYSIWTILTKSGHQYFEASAVLITIVIFGRYLEAKARGKTSDAIKKLIRLKPKTATIIRNKKEIVINVDDVQEGNIVIVKPGERIPVDGIVFEGKSAIDESMMTGESIPVEKKKDDEIIGATINKHGFFTFKATRVGANTTLAQIIKLIQDAQGSKAPIQRFADSIAGFFVPAVLVIALTTLIIWVFVQKAESSFALIAAVSVLVIACPCALGLATPTAIMVGTGKGARKGILIKGGEPLETLHKIKAIIFDKTGTITRGELEVTDIIQNNITPKQLLTIAASLEKGSEHSLADAIVNKSKQSKISLKKAINFKAIPGHGISAKLQNKQYYFGNQRLMKKNNVIFTPFQEQITKLETKGKTVMLLSENKKLLGIIAVADTIKPTSKKAIQLLNKMHIKVYMITGDNKRTAKAIAESAGIDNFFGEVLPKDKANYVKKLQKKGKVAMVGDGINDAPALAQADIAIAMGSGTDIAMETGEVVLMKDDPLDVVKAIKLSRMTMSKIRQNLFWALFYNSLGIPIAAGLLYPWTGWLLNPMIAGAAMAMSSLSVVLNSLLLRFKSL